MYRKIGASTQIGLNKLLFIDLIIHTLLTTNHERNVLDKQRSGLFKILGI